MKTNAPNKTLLAATCAVLLAGSNSAWAAWTNEDVRIYGSSTASGYKALCNMSITAASTAANTAHGYQALMGGSVDNLNNPIYITGVNNTAIGREALYKNTTGSNNTANGNVVLYSNTEGIQNTATGSGALNKSIDGDNNTAHGTQGLESNTTGNGNTATGFHALNSNTTGNYNTGYGQYALNNNNTGNNNTMNGYFSNSLETSNNTAIGAYSGASGLGNNTAIGHSAGIPAYLSITNATIIASQPGTSLIAEMTTNKVRIGNANVQVIEGNASWSSTSDKRLKNNIADLPLGLDFISKLRPVEYIRNNNTEKTKEWGLIAQELQQTLKDVGYKNAGVVSKDETPDKYLTVRYNDLLAPMIKAIQELKKEKTELQKIDQEQQKTIKNLFKRLEMLEKKAK